MNPPTVAAANPFQPIQKRLVILPANADRFTAVTAGHHVIGRPGILESRLLCHDSSEPWQDRRVVPLKTQGLVPND